MVISQFQTVGRDLFTRGLVSSHSGNLSIRPGERVIITRRGSMFNCLQEHDLIETGISKNNRSTPLASADLAIHRAIYRETQALAIIHAHPPHAVALSMTETEIVPSVEGLNVTGTVPVVDWKIDEKLRNLDLLRWNQVWLKTSKWDVVFYSHLNEIYSNIIEWNLIKAGTTLWTIWITWIPDKNYTDYHLHFAIHKNPYNNEKIGQNNLEDYMKWDWYFKWKSKEFILQNQSNIFSSNNSLTYEK